MLSRIHRDRLTGNPLPGKIAPMPDSRVATASPRPPTGRFAPSPTGPLHFGSLVVALGSYCLARQAGGRWLVRLEDLDRPRTVAGAADAILQLIEACGLNWDGPVLRQSERTARYREVLAQLRQQQDLFDCACSRREILASAPHPGEEGPVYPGTCRAGLPPGRSARAVRLRVAGEPVCFTDGLYGPQAQHLPTAVGDFVLLRADGVFSYQLAVVVDDIDQGVTQVVRGADLLASTPRQIYLYGRLGAAAPDFVHLPLALQADGSKMSKRDGAMSGLLPGAEGRWLWRALEFLGQAPPAELAGAPGPEVTAWAVAYFRLDRVPQQARVPAHLRPGLQVRKGEPG